MTILCTNCGQPMIPSARKGHWLHAKDLKPQCTFKDRAEAVEAQKRVHDLMKLTGAK